MITKRFIWQRCTTTISLAALSLILATSVATPAFAKSQSDRLTAPEIQWDRDSIIASDNVFEHDKSSIVHATLVGSEVVVTRTDASGKQERISSFPKQKLEFISSFHQTKGNGYLINGGAYVIKVNKKGVLEWEYTSSDANSMITATEQLKDGSYVVAVSLPSTSTINANTVKLIHINQKGNPSSSFELDGLLFDHINALQATRDGGYTILGESYVDGNSENIYMAKLNRAGHILWQNSYMPAPDRQNIWNTAIAESKDGSIAVTGFYNHPNPDGSYCYQTTGYVLHVNSSGKQDWLRTLDPSLDRSMLNDIQATDKDDLVVTGTVNQDWHGTLSKQYVLKLNDTGEQIWETTINRATFNSGLIILPLKKERYLLMGSADGLPKITLLGIDKPNKL